MLPASHLPISHSLSFVSYKAFPGHSHSTAMHYSLQVLCTSLPCTCLPAAPHTCQACAHPRAFALAAMCMNAFSKMPFCVCSLTFSRSFPFRVKAGDEIHSQYLNERGRRVGDAGTLRNNGREVSTPEAVGKRGRESVLEN